MARFRTVMTGSFCGVLLAACGQGAPVFPDVNASSQCGDWYPHASAEEGDGTTYGMEVGAVFPCLAWETVRMDRRDTYFNVGELFLQAKHGVTPVTAMVVVLVGANCAGCRELVGAISERAQQFAATAFMIGVCRDDTSSGTTIDQVEEVLLENDGWPQGWMITNDAEGHLSSDEFSGVPWVFVVELASMKVVAGGLGAYSEHNIDELLAVIQTL